MNAIQGLNLSGEVTEVLKTIVQPAYIYVRISSRPHAAYLYGRSSAGGIGCVRTAQ